MAIKLAISRCLLGDSVRYDGTAKRCDEIFSYAYPDFDIIPFCPEVAIGMGIPRLPIRLDKVEETIRARRINDTSFDYTNPLQTYALNFFNDYPDLKGVISKKGSPSCGYLNTKLYDKDIISQYDESGIFIAKLRSLIPSLLIIDELDFVYEIKRSKFLKQLKTKRP